VGVESSLSKGHERKSLILVPRIRSFDFDSYRGRESDKVGWFIEKRNFKFQTPNLKIWGKIKVGICDLTY